MKPWEKYQNQTIDTGPWNKYQTTNQESSNINPNTQHQIPNTGNLMNDIGQILSNNLQQAGQRTYTEGVAPILKGVDTALFGVPRTILKGAGLNNIDKTIFPEQETLEGKAATLVFTGAGLLKGAAAKLGEGLANRIAPELLPKIGLSIKAGEVAARQKAVLANKITRDAIMGGVIGLTQLNPDEQGHIDLGGQLGQGALGAGLGVAAPIVQTYFGKAVRGFRKFKTPERTAYSKLLSETAKEKLALQKEAIRLDKTDKVENLKQSIQDTINLRKTTLSDVKISSERQIKDTASRLKKNVMALDNALKNTTEEVSRKVQEWLPSFYRSNSKTFEKQLDLISEKLIKEGNQLTVGEISKMLDDVSGHLDEAFITEGSPLKAIENLRAKYGIDFVSSPGKFFSGQTGLPVGGPITSNADQVVPLKEFFNDIKTIRNSLSAAAKSGASRFTQEDVAVSIFNKGTADLLESRVPDLARLREAYAPVIQAMKVSNRIFKPFKGSFETKTGTALLKKFALGKTEQGEELLLKAIQEGSDFAPGIGNITDSLRNQGMRLIEAKQNINPMLDEIRQLNITQTANMDREFASQLMKLRSDVNFVNSNSEIKQKMLEDVVAKRLKQIGVRQRIIDNLSKDKAKIKVVFKALLYGGGITGAAAGVHQFLKRFGR